MKPGAPLFEFQSLTGEDFFQFVGAGIVVMLVAAALSLRWFSRLP